MTGAYFVFTYTHNPLVAKMQKFVWENTWLYNTTGSVCENHEKNM